MPKLSDDTVLQRAIGDAILDRKDFSDAYGNRGIESEEALSLIASLIALKGKSFKTMTQDEQSIAREAFIYGEQWNEGLIQARVNTKQSRNRIDWYREVRIRRWGRTKLESILENTSTISIHDLLRLSVPC